MYCRRPISLEGCGSICRGLAANTMRSASADASSSVSGRNNAALLWQRLACKFHGDNAKLILLSLAENRPRLASHQGNSSRSLLSLMLPIGLGLLLWSSLGQAHTLVSL